MPEPVERHDLSGTAGAAHQVADGAPPQAFRTVLRHRNFVLLWSGQTLSSVGNRMLPIALSLLILDRDGDATTRGVVLGIQAFALVLGILLAAVVGDRMRRTRVMVVADAVRFIAVVGLSVSPADLSLVLMCAMVLAAGIGEGLFQPAFSATVPRLVPQPLLQPANGLNSFSLYFSSVVGPGLAGLLATVQGPQLVLWVNAGTFVVSLATLVAIREADQHRPQLQHATTERAGVREVVDDLRAGVTAVVNRPWLLATIVMSTAVMTLVVAPTLVLLPIEAERRLGGSGAYGTVLAALGVGSLVGSLVGGRVRSRRPGVVALTAAMLNAASMAGLALLPLPGVAVSWALAGAGVTVFEVLWITAVQRDVPDELMARVMALDWLGSQALTPLGYALAGPAINLFGARALLLTGAVIVLLVTPLPLLTRGGAVFASAPPPSRPPGDADRS